MSTKANVNVKGSRVFTYARWSTDPQSWGDSERRQRTAAESWCAHNDCALADERFIDAGVSARSGRNRQGNLGRLLSIAKPGDILLVEDADRLSRQDWLTGMNFLSEILAKGVKVVTLSNGNEITEDNFRRNPGVFLPAILKQFLANDENEKRAHRVREAMDTKRRLIEQGKATFGRLPGWLRWSAPPKDSNRKPVVVSEKVETVRKIFKLCIEGKGVQEIVNLMRDTPAVANTKNPNWNKGSVHHLLKDRAVLGIHVGSDTPNVFPQIIDRETFALAAEKLKQRKNYSVVLKHRNNSLFTNIAVCAKCGQPLRKQSCRGSGKTYYYLVCGGHLQKKSDCKFASVSYAQFESSFAFALTHSVKIRELLSEDGSAPSQIDRFRDELAAVQGRLNELLKELRDETPARRVMDLIKELEAKETELQAKVDAEALRVKNQPAPVKAYEQLAALDLSNEDHREKVRALLPDLLTKISVELGQNRYTIEFKNGKQLPVSWGSAGTWMMMD